MQIRLFIAPLLLLALFSFAEEESKWEETIQKFEKLDVEIPPPENPVLFVGSSSIVFWRTLASDMAPLNVLNRGFGGSRMFELNEFRDRIVTNYNPKAIVIYEGDNDVKSGLSVESILAEFDDFVTHVRANTDVEHVFFLAVKPSIARAHLWETIQEVNQGLISRAEADEELTYLDIATPMLTDAGTVREELFVEDGLHINAEGYRVWTSVVRPSLMAVLHP